jgi:hypothetical protein
VGVEITGAGRGIEDGAGEGAVTLEIGVGRFVVAVVVDESAGLGITRKIRGEEGNLGLGAGDHGHGPFRIADRQLGEAAAQTLGVQAVDREGAVAALGAPRTAGQAVAGPRRGFVHGVADDVQEPAVGAFQGGGLPAHCQGGYHRQEAPSPPAPLPSPARPTPGEGRTLAKQHPIGGFIPNPSPLPAGVWVGDGRGAGGEVFSRRYRDFRDTS